MKITLTILAGVGVGEGTRHDFEGHKIAPARSLRSLASSAANSVRLLDASPFVKLRVLSYEPTAVRSRYLYQKSGASVLTAFLQNTRK